MASIYLGIPILNRLDLLKRCLQGIDCPAEIVVINNSSDDTFRTGLVRLADERGAGVLHQERNRGVAGSWNLICRTGFDRGHDWIFIGSNDTFLTPGSLKRAIELVKDPTVGVWHLHAWNFFLLHRRTIDAVGWFDENFYPAYKEDQDYSYRCKIAGVRRMSVPGSSAVHVGSATIRSNRVYAKRCRRTKRQWNSIHYRMKWGGDVGKERYRTPYGRHDHDHRWWPDPGGSIAARDWDQKP